MSITAQTATRKIAVLGAGSWGTALALNCARQSSQFVYLWGHHRQHVTDLNRWRENRRYLPGVALPENIQATDDIAVVYDCDALLLVVPSTAFAEVLAQIQPYFAHQAIGWAIDYAVVAGPSFAKEVAANLPTAVTVAGNSLVFAQQFARFLHSKNLRTYTSDDIIGAQIGGALKNVIAIAAGIADGLGFGANTRALSGLGDLLLTCTDDLSRNRRFGLLLGQGRSVEQALADIGQTVEGLFTAQEAQHYAQQYAVRAPIIDIVAAILSNQLSVDAAMQQLLRHQPKPEID
ncbi:MAG: glycerol-3-phosphate dehydrogenase [Gammaproteobacteria bacterium]|nr:MAG: glycerol-3-phosphate dehydrogenase [Gammaproteobacteria bacterium]